MKSSGDSGRRLLTPNSAPSGVRCPREISWIWAILFIWGIQRRNEAFSPPFSRLIRRPLLVPSLEALATPLWKWTQPLVLNAAPGPRPEEASPVTFVDVAEKAGLNVTNVWGGVRTKKYIIEAKGSGLAFFDYDQDGWLDIYLTNGLRLEGEEPYPGGKTPTQHLFKNNRDGTFTDVTERRPRPHRLGHGRLRGRLRQRRLGRFVLLLLGPQRAVAQQRRRHLHRCHQKGRDSMRSASAGARAAPGSITIATAISISSWPTTLSLI